MSRLGGVSSLSAAKSAAGSMADASAARAALVASTAAVVRNRIAMSVVLPECVLFGQMPEPQSPVKAGGQGVAPVRCTSERPEAMGVPAQPIQLRTGGQVPEQQGLIL